MNKIIDLGLARNYVRDWKSVDAIRELTQNCIDEGDYEINYEDGNLHLKNFNNFIGIDKLALGQTTKYNDNNKIGKFGEGFKVGLLVLIRDNYKVEIINGNQKWIPKLIVSENYGIETLHCEIFEENDFSNNDVEFIIYGCFDIFDDLLIENLHFRKEVLGDDLENIETDYGRLILDEEFKGMIYVNGLFIQEDSNFEYGFDFEPKYVNLDRDRKAINIYELRKLVAKTIIDSNDGNIIYKSYKDDNISNEIIDNVYKINDCAKSDFIYNYEFDKKLCGLKYILVEEKIKDYLLVEGNKYNSEFIFKVEEDDEIRELINENNDNQDFYEQICEDYSDWNDRKNEIPQQLEYFNSSDFKKTIVIYNKVNFILNDYEKEILLSLIKSQSHWKFSKIFKKIDWSLVTEDDYKLECLLEE